MKVYRGKDYEEVSRIAAGLVAAQIIEKPDSVLGMATGSTPVGAYEQLIQKYERGGLDFSAVRCINLDEYRGLSGDDERSYRYYMDKHLYNRINIDRRNTFLPDGTEPDRDKACRDYDEIIRSHGGIDLQILGLGHNGHIGFNEPADVFAKGTYCVALAGSTIAANARFFASADEVPKEAYTMGIQSIMGAGRIMMLVSGEGKRDIVKRAFLGPITPRVPASVLQLHRDVILVGDEAALSEIDEIE